VWSDIIPPTVRLIDQDNQNDCFSYDVNYCKFICEGAVPPTLLEMQHMRINVDGFPRGVTDGEFSMYQESENQQVLRLLLPLGFVEVWMVDVHFIHIPEDFKIVEITGMGLFELCERIVKSACCGKRVNPMVSE
jgi:hypothetical protein